MRSLAVPTAAALERLIEHAERAGAKVHADQSELRHMGALGAWAVPGRRDPRASRAARAGRYADGAGQRPDVLGGARGTRGTVRRGARGSRGRRGVHRELGLELGDAIAPASAPSSSPKRGRLDESADAFARGDRRMRELGQTAFLSTMLIELGDVLYRRASPRRPSAWRSRARSSAPPRTSSTSPGAPRSARRIAADRGRARRGRAPRARCAAVRVRDRLPAGPRLRPQRARARTACRRASRRSPRRARAGARAVGALRVRRQSRSTRAALLAEL